MRGWCVLGMFLALTGWVRGAEAADAAVPVVESLLTPLDTLLPPGAVYSISGNGGLTAGFDETGRLVSCRYPSPGHQGQLYWRDGAGEEEHAGGAQWAVRAGDALHFLSNAADAAQVYPQPRSTIVETVSTLPGNLRCVQTAFVHPVRDVLVLRLQVEGAAVDAFAWYQHWAPATRRLPLPAADVLLSPWNGFAVFADAEAGAVTHFRPEAPSSVDWERARELRDGAGSLPDWRRFGQGVWIQTRAANSLAGWDLGPAHTPESAWESLRDAETPANPPASVGLSDSALWLAPTPTPTGQEATVFIGFGVGYEEAAATAAHAKDQGFDQLLLETRAYWVEWLEQVSFSEPEAPGMSRERALLTMAQATDRASGAIVSAPISWPPLALAVPSNAAFLTLALDRSGMHALAGANLGFYLSSMQREGDRKGVPAGAVPSALHADGLPAAPSFFVETNATAWLLSAVWLHTRQLDEQARVEKLDRFWDSVQSAGDFLAAWVHPSSGDVLPAFQPHVLRDAVTPEGRLLAWLGLRSALALAETAGREPGPAWEAQLRELETRLRFEVLNQESPWVLTPALLFWLGEVLGEEAALWPAQVALGESVVSLEEAVLEFPPEALLPPHRDTLRFSALDAALTLIVQSQRVYELP